MENPHTEQKTDVRLNSFHDRNLATWLNKVANPTITDV